MKFVDLGGQTPNYVTSNVQLLAKLTMPIVKNTATGAELIIQCVSKKNIPDISSCNSRKHCRIFIMFGTHVTEKVSNQ